ncbi:MAG: hypothetical protein IPN68_17880 [Bacteroidetes bacterium]|nr:hypothetical protein [Bacteroidota bacterium]
MGINLHEIEDICSVASGIKKIQITTVDNVAAGGSHAVIDAQKVFRVYFRKNTATYKEKSESSEQNKKIAQEISFFLPGRRTSVDLLIEKIINKRIVVTYEDWAGATGMLYKASMSYEYGPGRKRTDGNGYDMKFTTEKVIGSLAYEGVLIDLPDPGTPWEGAVPGIMLQNTWVLVEPEIILTIPEQTGNTEYLNKFVVAPNGIKYFIDVTGRAMAFPMMPQYYQSWTGVTSDEITVTNGALPTAEQAKRLFLFLNGNQQMYLATTPPPDEGQVALDGQKIKFSRALEATDRVELYWVPDF